MPGVLEAIEVIARQRGRGESSPLILLRQLDPRSGERITHLPIETEFGQAWLAMTSESFRPHQAQAITALRRGEAVALCADDPTIAETAYLLAYATALSVPGGTALLLAPDRLRAQDMHDAIGTINENLPRLMTLPPTLIEQQMRPNPYARIVIATPDTLHNRLLRHHDRAWKLFWRQLRISVIIEAQMYSGVAGAHLADLLLRIQRVAATYSDGYSTSLVATMPQLADPQSALTALISTPWRVIRGDDGAAPTTTLAVWQGTNDRLRESAEVALALQRSGFSAHLLCTRLEALALAPMVDEVEDITYGDDTPEADVLIAVGYPGSHAALMRLLRSEYRAVLLVLGALPHERGLARMTESLLRDTTSLPEPPVNAYVIAQHLLCAASELPLTETEVAAWGAQDIVDRLVAHDQLVDLPDPELAWKPGHAISDPYVEFSMLSSSGGPIYARDEQGRLIDLLDPTGFERWTFPGAALPPGAGGLRVIKRDEEAGSVTLRLESNGRRTYPLRRCSVTIRDERDSRPLFANQRAKWGRVVVDEEIYGYRETTTSGVPSEIALTSPLTARWIAPACWFELTDEVQPQGQFIGWSLAAALALRTTASITDIVPCYDRKARRLYLVDAQPGGNGLTSWIYHHAEELLPLAYDIALACRTDPLLEPQSRVDMDWLLVLLGRTKEPLRLEPPRQAEPVRAQIETPRRQESELPPPTVPRLILPPEEPPALPQREAVRPERRAPEPPAPISEQRQESLPLPPPRNRTPEPPKEPRPARRERRADRRSKRGTADSAPQREQAEPRPERRTPEPPPPPPEPPAPEPEDEGPPDAEAMIARLRQRRVQQEAARRVEQPARQRATNRSEPVLTRFATGDKIFCLPYGDGRVEESRIEDGREILTVLFPDHGELTIDPSVSLVRKIEIEDDSDDLL